ncbi:hypothetical protein GCM10009780_61710 [Actinomadura alba]
MAVMRSRHSFAPVRERNLRGQHVPAMLGVGQFGERGGQPDADLAIRGDADCLVPKPLAGLPVSGQEPARSFPFRTPLLGGLLGGGEVVTLLGQPPAAPYH